MKPLVVLLGMLVWLGGTSFDANAVEKPGERGEETERLKVMFLGGDGHHHAAHRAALILPAFRERGIDLIYTDERNDLNPQTLQHYDAILFYADYEEMTEAQEQALLDYVAGGGGFVPVHSASGMFQNSEAYVELIGASLEEHEAVEYGIDRNPFVEDEPGFRRLNSEELVRTERRNEDHPAIQAVSSFVSWEEIVRHDHHASERTVLEVRPDGDRDEPWTWVRTHGEGRVFYTAWGHDLRTWANEGFQDLLEQGIRWAAGDEAMDAEPPGDPFEYDEAELPSLEYNTTVEYERELRSIQQSLDVETSMERIVVPPEFDVELFAAEPDIVNPIAMAWDERGRLWIAETRDYPNPAHEEGGEESGEGRDRIRILEDTNGDGTADSFTVFAENLSVPTSIAFANGGVIVAQAPDILFLKDTDGDDKADVREVLFSGWNTWDTHAGPSNLRWGFDNQIWGVVGYAGFEGEVGGEQHEFAMGFYRFAPDGSSLEFIRGTNNNTWGLGFSEDGAAFASTANNNPSVYMPIAKRYYEGVRGWGADRLGSIAENLSVYPITRRTRQGDHKGKYTSGSGHALYTARAFPEKYWNRMAFVADPTVHLLGQFAIEPEGSDYVARNKWSMLASDDEWTSPIVAEVGPDGALWVIDWYNYIPQHNLGPFAEGWEHDENNAYITALRDREHGRIYRIAHKDAEPAAPMRLDDASPQELVEALRHDNMFWRMTAQRLLVDRGEQDVLDDLYELVGDTSTDAVGLSPGALHALWTLHGLGALDGTDDAALDVATEALQHPSASVRGTALQVLPRTEAMRETILDSDALDDDDAKVRLQALLALSEMPSSEQAGQAVFEALQEQKNHEDAWIPDAAAIAGAQHSMGFMKAAHESAEGVSDDQSPESVRRVIGIVSFHHLNGTLAGGDSSE